MNLPCKDVCSITKGKKKKQNKTKETLSKEEESFIMYVKILQTMKIGLLLFKASQSALFDLHSLGLLTPSVLAYHY
jgi:hypothetical protein